LKVSASTFWIVALVVATVAVGVAAPAFLDLFLVLRLTVYIAMAVFALSQGLVWGYAGIPSFGQAAFFGLGGYVYAIAVFNFGDSTIPILLAVLLPALFAALLGWFLFYGRLSDMYLAVITLAVTLIFHSFIRSAGSTSYTIGNTRLGGYDGIPAVPPFNVPGDPTGWLDPGQTFQVYLAVLVATYLGMRWLLATRFGRVAVAIRENETRVDLLGYDARRYKLGVFVISGAVAGLAGCLFVAWGGFVSPFVFSLAITAQAVIFVLVGGLGTLIGPIIGALFIQYLTTALATQQFANTGLVIGAIMIAFVMLVPRGIVPTAQAQWRAFRHRQLAERPAPAPPAEQKAPR
jgi:branched-chain amino acid transport system permease protein